MQPGLRPTVIDPALKVLCPRYPARLLRGQLCDLARDKTGTTGEHTGRRLRELTEEGILEVQYRRGHAFLPIKRSRAPTLPMNKLPKCQNAKCKKRVKEWQRTFFSVRCFRKSTSFKAIRAV